MPVPTTTQLQRLRSRPHRTRLWLGIYEPVTILSAAINHPDIPKGTMSIDVTELTGSLSNVVPGMTCYIGSTPGGKDYGRIRVKDTEIVPGQVSTLIVAENSRDWHDDWYLTVVEYYEPWTVLPRIVLDENNVDTWFKDYDIGYNDQNQILDPIVCMGPHHAGFIPHSGAYSVWYTSSGTQDLSYGATFPAGASYEWYFGPTGSATPSGSSAADPGWVTYHSASFYTTRLTVTTAEGKSYTGYRHIMVYEKPGEGPQRPIVEWGMDDFSGSRDDGNYEVGLWVRERAGFSRVVDGALVVIWSDDWQDGVEGAIGGNAENRESIFFVGYIQEDSIELDPVTNRLDFVVQSITGSMKDIATDSIALNDTETTMRWYEMRHMTVDRAVIHALRWHSTVLAVCDFHPTGDARYVHYADFDRDSLYESVNGFYESTIGARMVSDRQGKIWSEVDIHITPTGSERDDIFQTILNVTRRDWRSEISFDRMFEDKTAYLLLGGIGYSGPVTGTDEPYLAGAPGDAPGYRGGIDREQGLVLTGQGQLNILTGNWYARLNADYPSVTIPLAGDYRVIDIAPQERLSVSLEADDTWRRLVWDEKPFVPVEITYEYQADEQALLTDLTVREETFGEIGTKVEIPVVPPWDDPGDPWWKDGLPILPPIEPFPFPIPTPGPGDLVYVCTTNRIGRTRTFQSPFPLWERVDTDMSGTFMTFELDYVDPLNTAWLLSNYGLYKTTNLDSATPTWACVHTAAQFVSDTGNPTGSSIEMDCFKQVRKRQEYLAVSVTCDAGGPDFLRYLRSEDGGVNFTLHPLIDGTPPKNQDFPIQIYLQEAMPGWGITYHTTRYHASYGMQRSLTGGEDWMELFTWRGAIGCIVPYQGNAACYGLYIGTYITSDWDWRGVMRSMDMGLNWETDQPYWGGYLWAPSRGHPSVQWAREWACVDQYNSAHLYAFMQRSTIVPAYWRDKSALFWKPSWYSDWEFRGQFDGHIGGIHMLQTDPLKLFALGRWQSANPPTFYIGGSDDGGLSWANKMGDWEDTVGSILAPDNLHFTPQAIRAVWTA